MREEGDFSPYRKLAFDVRGPFCGDGEDGCKIPPDLPGLRFKVTEVHGTSSTVAEGERYVVRGEYEYEQTDGEAYAASLAVFGAAFGATAHLAPGVGSFEAGTEVLELSDGAPNGLGVVVANRKTGSADIVRWVMLKQ